MSEHRKKWFQQIVEAYEQKLLFFVWRIVKRLEIAREIVQETFLKLWQQEGLPPEKLKPWLYQVCRRAAIDHLRKEKTMSAEELDEAKYSASTEDRWALKRLEQQQEKFQLLNQLESLSDKHREVIRLKFEEEMSYKEISDVTGHSSSYVGVLIHEAIWELRQRLAGRIQKGVSQ